MYNSSLVIIHMGILVASGCGLTPDVQEGAAEQALTADFVDASGAVTVRITQCPPTAAQEHNTTTCSVDSDFVLIGGGAEILGESTPGALLTGSFPNLDKKTWTASSKDQRLASFHQLRAYAVGLKLAGVSALTLSNFVTVVSLRSTRSGHPSTSIGVPGGFNLIGGGARANWSTEGQLLTRSIPSGSQWLAASKEHVVAESGTVDAFVIGITSGTIPGFGSIDVTVNQASTGVPTGYGTANRAVPAGWVLASIGGEAQYASAGRMLTDLIPFVDAPTDAAQGATVRSKDHEVQDAGTTSVYVVAIRKH
jgi:vibriolysin